MGSRCDQDQGLSAINVYYKLDWFTVLTYIFLSRYFSRLWELLHKCDFHVGMGAAAGLGFYAGDV